MSTTRGNQSFDESSKPGRSATNAEDFFASSPTANLVGVIEEGRTEFQEIVKFHGRALSQSLFLCEGDLEANEKDYDHRQRRERDAARR